MQFHVFKDLIEIQKYFDEWRNEYNLERPHESLSMETPVTRYKLSERKYPETMPEIEYRSSDVIRVVDGGGNIYFKNKSFFVSEALSKQKVALRPYEDGKYNVVYCDQKIKRIDLRKK